MLVTGAGLGAGYAKCKNAYSRKKNKKVNYGYESKSYQGQKSKWEGYRLVQKPEMPSPKVPAPEIPAQEVPKPEVPSPEVTESIPEPTKPASNDVNTETMLNLINRARGEQGLNPVSMSSTLNSAALAKAQDMQQNNYFAHTSPSGKPDFQFIKDSGYVYRAAASNLAKGNFGSDEAVFNAWMESAGHKANILTNQCTEIGYAKAGEYYVLFLASPM